MQREDLLVRFKKLSFTKICKHSTLLTHQDYYQTKNFIVVIWGQRLFSKMLKRKDFLG